MKMEQVILGDGNLIISGVSMGGVEGIAIYQLINHGHEIDAAVKNVDLESLPHINIYVRDLKAARLLQDQINSMVLRMNGYDVQNKEEGE